MTKARTPHAVTKDETMTRLNAGVWYGFAGGVLAALTVMAAMGAATTPPRPTPRYSVQPLLALGTCGLVVTDNQTNKLYMYSPDTKAKEPEFTLSLAIDLSQAGKAVMKGEAGEKPTENASKPSTK